MEINVKNLIEGKEITKSDFYKFLESKKIEFTKVDENSIEVENLSDLDDIAYFTNECDFYPVLKTRYGKTESVTMMHNRLTDDWNIDDSYHAEIRDIMPECDPLTEEYSDKIVELYNNVCEDLDKKHDVKHGGYYSHEEVVTEINNRLKI